MCVNKWVEDGGVKNEEKLNLAGNFHKQYRMYAT
jgi:hypothetical protein